MAEVHVRTTYNGERTTENGEHRRRQSRRSAPCCAQAKGRTDGGEGEDEPPSVQQFIAYARATKATKAAQIAAL